MKKTCAIMAALLLASACHVHAQEVDTSADEIGEVELPAASAASGRPRGPMLDQGEDAADVGDEPVHERSVRVSSQPLVAEHVDIPEDDEADAARHALAARNWAMLREQAAAAAAGRGQVPGYAQAHGYPAAPAYAAPVAYPAPVTGRPGLDQPAQAYPAYGPPGYPAPTFGAPGYPVPYGTPHYASAPAPTFPSAPYAPTGHGQPGYPAQPAAYTATAPDGGTVGQSGIVRIRRDNFTGHFVAHVMINGVRVRAVLDTGATSTVLSPDAARATGAIRDITHTMPAAGIGGVTMLNVTRVRSFVIGGREIGGFEAMIGAGAIQDTLLGQTELRKLGRIVIEDDVLTIEPKGARLAAR